jgi:hypothetical protein
MKITIQLSNITLRTIGDQLKEVANPFEVISFTHIYQELNKEADALSMKTWHIPKGTLILEEVREDTSAISSTNS